MFFFTAILRILTYFWSDVGWLLPFVAALFEATAVSDAEPEAEAEFALPTIKNVSMLFSAKKPSRSPPWPGSTSKAPWRFSKAAFDTWTRLEESGISFKRHWHSTSGQISKGNEN